MVVESSTRRCYPPHMVDGSYLTTREAAERFGVSAKTVGRWVDAGILPAVFTAGGHRRIRTGDVERFVASRRSLLAPGPGDQMLRIVVIAADRAVIEVCSGAAPRIEVAASATALEAGMLIGMLLPQLVLVDTRIGALDAPRTCRAIRRAPFLPFVVALAAATEPPEGIAVLERAAHRVLRLPLDAADVRSALHDARQVRE